MAEDLVLYRLQGAVAVLTLNRPERKNAWTIPLQRHYLGLLERCEHDPAVRAIVVTGAGPTFCPGADTAELTVYTQTGDFNPEMAQIEQPDYYPLLVGKPMIAAINGACAGIGMMQTLMCDVRIAVTFSTDEAAAMGLIHRIVPAGEALAAALDYAADLAANCSPASIRTMKAQLRAAADEDVLTSIANGLELERQALASDDFAEGVASFVERRASPRREHHDRED
ncbi:MAG: enoyl-CoA hydratase-related protein [Streptosporangiaceae bacterium]